MRSDVNFPIRYGIVTPYTSYLVTEDWSWAWKTQPALRRRYLPAITGHADRAALGMTRSRKRPTGRHVAAQIDGLPRQPRRRAFRPESVTPVRGLLSSG